MSLAKHDDVIQQLAAQRTHPSFAVPVLPRRTRRDADLADGQVSCAGEKCVCDAIPWRIEDASPT
jgi:hypothetical protein